MSEEVLAASRASRSNILGKIYKVHNFLKNKNPVKCFTMQNSPSIHQYLLCISGILLCLKDGFSDSISLCLLASLKYQNCEIQIPHMWAGSPFFRITIPVTAWSDHPSISSWIMQQSPFTQKADTQQRPKRSPPTMKKKKKKTQS